MDIRVTHRAEGEPTDGRLIAQDAVMVFPEMRWQSSTEDAIERIVRSIEENDRIEITATSQEGQVIGFACVVHDEDDHVGPCLGVQWNFVLPESRGSVGIRMWREIRKLAAGLPYEVLAYTHRVGPAAYLIRYMRLRPRRGHGKEGQEGI